MRNTQLVIAWILLFFLAFPLHAHKNTMTLYLKDAPLRDTLYALAKALHYDAIISEKITGTITLNKTSLLPTQLLTIISKQYGLKWERHHDILIFTTQQEWLAQKERELQEETIVKNHEPLQLTLMTLRYANALTLLSLIKNTKPSLLSARGHIEADQRTNTLLIHDTRTAIRTIKKAIFALDKPVKQLLIETYLVSINNDNEKEFGLSFDHQNHANHSSRFPLTINTWHPSQPLHLTLSLMEKKGQAEIISSPRLFTADQETASIETGEEVPYQESSDNGGTTIAFKKAVLGLKITPHILPGGRIALNVHMNHDMPTTRLIKDVPTITTRQITTNVILKNKETIVLGGIYEKEREESILGIIGISKLPLLGHLLNKRIIKQHKRELLIFVTPIIMNQ